jgi:hypothetical protein
MQFQSSQRALEFIEAWLSADSSQPIECQLGLLDEGGSRPDELSEGNSLPYG